MDRTMERTITEGKIFREDTFYNFWNAGKSFRSRLSASAQRYTALRDADSFYTRSKYNVDGVFQFESK